MHVGRRSSVVNSLDGTDDVHVRLYPAGVRTGRSTVLTTRCMSVVARRASATRPRARGAASRGYAGRRERDDATMDGHALLTTALLCTGLGAVTAQLPPPPRGAVVRLPVEGGSRTAFCATPSTLVSESTASSTTAGTTLRAQRRQAGPPWGTTVDTPKTHWYQGGDGKPQVTELATPTAINATCLLVDGGVTTVDGPASIFTSRDNGTTWDNGTRVQYFETVSVAFGLRPFIQEVNGTLLLEADPSLVTELQQADPSVQESVRVTLRLPFASTGHQQIVWKGGGLLQQLQTVLYFPLAQLPSTVNQDVEIEISLPGGRQFSKLRRLMRAPPPVSKSFVQPVQVDHFTRSLRVDGRPFQGVGFYLDGLAINSLYPNGAPGFGGYANLTQVGHVHPRPVLRLELSIWPDLSPVCENI